MRTKSFVIFLFSMIITSILLVIFGQQKPSTIQNIVSTTHQHLRNFHDTLRDAESKTFTADEKYITRLGLNDGSRYFPKDVWHNTSLPVLVTYALQGQESHAIGLMNNVAKVLPNNTILIYDLGLRSHELKQLLSYCNNSHCQVVTFDLNEYPSHVNDQILHAFRPIIIQDALYKTGCIFYIENNKRFHKDIKGTTITQLYNDVAKDTGILAWPMASKNAVSTLTHMKMFDYFHTTPDNFIFLPMVTADSMIVLNTESVRKEILLPWVQCTLTQDCIVPIGAQSGGCRFDKKPQYRYSGCHNYDTSALNIVLGLKFKFDSSRYTYNNSIYIFKTVSLETAIITLHSFEQNSTTEGRTQFELSTM